AKDASVDAKPDAAIDAPPGAAQITNVTSSTANGYYKLGAPAVSIQVTFDKAVTVDDTVGTPRLALNAGANAPYVTGSGTPTLTFSYTISIGNTSADLDYTSTSALMLAGGTIKNSGSVDAFLVLPAPGAAGSL